MGVLSKAATAECVENFDVSGIGAVDIVKDDVLVDIEMTALCRNHRHSFSWGQQRAAGIEGLRKVVKMVRDLCSSVLCDRMIPNQVEYCAALISVPAANQHLLVQQSHGRHILRMPAVSMTLHPSNLNEINKAFDELLD